ncbi:MAG: D-glycero-beta-D-manno-heptose-7-phosphate kinase [Bdellovibrio sp.]
MTLIKADRFNKIVDSFANIPPICVLGDVGIDKYTLGEVRRISPEAPVPILEVQEERLILGMSANISHNLKTLGIDSTLCSIIGEDQRASRFESLLEEIKLKTWGLLRDPSRPTIYKERISTSTQQICRIDYEDPTPISGEVEKKLINRIEDFSKTHSALILEDYSKGTLTPTVLRRSIDIFSEVKKLVAVDPGRHTAPIHYKGAGLIKPNLVEAKQMMEHLGYTYQKKSLEEMAIILSDKLEVPKVVITLGKDGMAIFDRESEVKLTVIPTVAQEVFDVSGAGDTTISLIVSSLLAGANLEEATWIANCGAGVVVAKKGTATVNVFELQEFYHRLARRFSK